jgi:hypothetical protein
MEDDFLTNVLNSSDDDLDAFDSDDDEEKDEENQSSECSKRVNSQTTVVKNYYFNL